MVFSVTTSSHNGENKSVEGNRFGSIKVNIPEKAKYYFLYTDLIIGMIWAPSILAVGEKYRYGIIFLHDTNLHVDDTPKCPSIGRS